MALVPGVALVAREDLAIFACTWGLDADTAGTLVNGTTPGFNFRNTSGVLVPPTGIFVQLDTVIAATVAVGATALVNDVVCTKAGVGLGSGAASAFHLILIGTKSKALG